MAKLNVPDILTLQAIHRTKNGKYQAHVVCTDDKRTCASGHVTVNDQLERCIWLPSGKCYHNDTGEYDLDFTPFQ